MAKLYPPVVEGTIPAFYGTTLVVPFSMNRAVGKADIIGFSLKIKTVQTNTYVGSARSSDYDLSMASFDISNLNLIAGQYYKVQIAYINTENVIGYYSMVGVTKYYGEVGPKTYIEDLSSKMVNLFTGYNLGIFEHASDPMEKVAQYKFVITDEDEVVVYDSDWKIHNTINDVNSLSSVDIFKYDDELDDDKPYYLQYFVITSNNMECASPRYRVSQRNSVSAQLDLILTGECDFDNGYVTLKLTGNNKEGKEPLLTGSFEIGRQNIKNSRHWESIFVFIAQNEYPSKNYWRDFTVEQGETYIYSIRQFNEAGVYSERVLSNEVFVDFEDAFLFDGKRQLKIRYNPKVSSFKNDILESKTDTIGSKYPFIFRNGHVNYKEFPVSGLISYWMDEEELFMKLEDIGIDDISNLSRAMTVITEKSINHVKYNYDLENAEQFGDLYEKNRKYAVENYLSKHYKTTDLTNYNIAAERKFKLEVLEWLTNGKPKLFRSPGEGNYVVRLLNTSLTPTDSVGRMLHTFQSTAYEICEYDYENLVAYNFIKNQLTDDEKMKLYYRTVPLYDGIIQGLDKIVYKPDENGYIELLTDPHNPLTTVTAYSIRFDDMSLGDMVYVDGEKRIIGNTGVYSLENLNGIKSVKIMAVQNDGFDTFSYNKALEAFNNELGRYNYDKAAYDTAFSRFKNKHELQNSGYTTYLDVVADETKSLLEYNAVYRGVVQRYNEAVCALNAEYENELAAYSEYLRLWGEYEERLAQWQKDVDNYNKKIAEYAAAFTEWETLYQKYLHDFNQAKADEELAEYELKLAEDLVKERKDAKASPEDIEEAETALVEAQIKKAQAEGTRTVAEYEFTSHSEKIPNRRDFISEPEELVIEDKPVFDVEEVERPSTEEVLPFRSWFTEEQQAIVFTSISDDLIEENEEMTPENVKNIWNGGVPSAIVWEAEFAWQSKDKVYHFLNVLPEPMSEDIVMPEVQDYYYYVNNNILNDSEGIFTYSYKDIYANSFDLIAGQLLEDVPLRQFNGRNVEENLINEIVDTKTELIDVLRLQVELKEVQDIYTFKDTTVTLGERVSKEQFNDLFSFDRTLAPGETNVGNSIPERAGEGFIPQGIYIYRIHPIFSHDRGLDVNEVPVNMEQYLVELSPWESSQTEEETYICPYCAKNEAEPTLYKMGNKKLVIPNYATCPKCGHNVIDYRRYNFNLDNNEDPADSHFDLIWEYKNKKWYGKEVVYHKNEQYYADMLYNRYYTFETGDYYLVYDEKADEFVIENGYCAKLYLNTGVTEGVTYKNGKLFGPDGAKLQPYLDMTDISEFKTTEVPLITDLYVGDALILNLSYQTRKILYNLENIDTELKEKQKRYDSLMNEYSTQYYYDNLNEVDSYIFRSSEWETAKQSRDTELYRRIYGYHDPVTGEKIPGVYQEYIDLLDDKIAAYKEEYGIE